MSTNRISLRSSTRISLNDRFNILRTSSNTEPNKMASTSRLNQQQGSARNKRLALQMANRPSVQAALRIKKKSIKQRLGTTTKAPVRPIRARLNRGNLRTNKIAETKKLAAAKSRPFRLNRNNFATANKFTSPKAVANAKPGFRRSQQPILNRPIASTSAGNRGKLNRNRINVKGKVGLAAKKQAILRGAKRFNGRGRFTGQQRTGPKNVGNRKNVINNINRVNNQRKPGPNVRGGRGRGGRFIRGRTGRGRGNARPAAGWQGKRNINRDQLDQDLDAYMAKTKTHLDNDLDAYMTSTN